MLPECKNHVKGFASLLLLLHSVILLQILMSVLAVPAPGEERAEIRSMDSYVTAHKITSVMCVNLVS